MRKTYERSGNAPYERQRIPDFSSSPLGEGLPAQTAAPDLRAEFETPETDPRPDQRALPLERTPDRRAPTGPEARTLQPKRTPDRYEPDLDAASPFFNASAAKKPQKKPVAAASALKDLMFLLIKLAIICFAFVLLFTFLFGVIRYQDSSMDPAIKDGDIVLFFRTNTDKYHPRDVVILDFNGKRQVRRVIATAGDTVNITEDGLLINGALQQEAGIYNETERYADGADFPLTVPEGQVFVLGDNRTGVMDSRVYGAVRIQDTLGKVMTVIRRRNI